MSVGSAELHGSAAGRLPPASTFALVALAIVAIVLGTLNVVALTGVLASDSDRHQAAPRSVRPSPPSNAVSKQPRSAPHRFVGEHFAIDHPAGWRVETAEAPLRSYLDTTIRSRKDRWVLLRVDVTPGDGGDPAVHAAEVERYLKPQQGYRRIELRRSKLGSLNAVYWEFTVVESGVRLRKVDVFLTDHQGNRVAVLTQTPAAQHEAYTPLLARLRASFVPLA